MPDLLELVGANLGALHVRTPRGIAVMASLAVDIGARSLRVQVIGVNAQPWN